MGQLIIMDALMFPNQKPLDLYKIDIFIFLYSISIFMTEAVAQVMHSPTLNTVLMIEDVLKEAKEIIKIAELKRRLPRKVMHSTVVQVLDYLQESGKILITTKGILWIYRPPAELEKLKQGGLEL